MHVAQVQCLDAAYPGNIAEQPIRVAERDVNFAVTIAHSCRQLITGGEPGHAVQPVGHRSGRSRHGAYRRGSGRADTDFS